jgi:hypothetical protein
MKKKLLLFIFQLVVLTLCAQNTSSFLWAKKIGGGDNNHVLNSATDQEGNLVLLGSFQNDSLDLGNMTLYNKEPKMPVYFLAKFNQQGNVTWAKVIQTYAGSVAGITIDYDGNILLSATYGKDSTKFDSFIMTFGDAKSGFFLAKYDTNGNALWVKGSDKSPASSTIYVEVSSIAIDASGNIVVTGAQNGGLTFGTTTLKQTGLMTLFIVKFDNAGKALWVKGAEIDNYFCFATTVTTDKDENVFISGYFSSVSIKFGPFTLDHPRPSFHYRTIFFVKYDKNGKEQWARQAGGDSSDDVATNIMADKNGDIYMNGSFASYSILFDTTLLKNHDYAKNDEFFLCKFNTNGKVLWAKKADGTFYDRCTGLLLDKDDNPVSAGNFGGDTTKSIKFDKIIVKQNGTDNPFIVKYRSTGEAVWAGTSTRSPTEKINGSVQSISSGKKGFYHLAGTFNKVIRFDTTVLRTTNINNDLFIAKMHECDIVTPTITVSGPTAFCYGDSVILTSSPSKFYKWNSGATTQRIVVKTGGNLWVTVTDSLGCSAISAKIKINPYFPLSVSVQSNKPTTGFCQGDTAVLTAYVSGVYPYKTAIYQWDNAMKDTVQRIKVISSGKFSVTVTDTNGCHFKASIETTVLALPAKPVIKASGYVLSTQPATGYQWQVDGADLASAKAQTYTATQNGKYTVTIKNASGCSLVSDPYYVTGISQQGLDWLWAKPGQSKTYNNLSCTSTDSAGNTFITGNFQNSIVFGSDTLTNTTNPYASNIFIVKYDPSGKVLWARKAEASSSAGPNSISVDQAGAVVTAGRFSTGTITFNSTVLQNTMNGSSIPYITKYDKDGKLIFASSFKTSYAAYLTTDAANNIYVTGTFYNSILIDKIPLGGFSRDDIFFAKLDPSGAAIWAKTFDRTSVHYGDRAAIAIECSKSGNGIFLSGSFFSNYKLDTIELKLQGSYSGFIAKFDTAGRVVWAKITSPLSKFKAMSGDKSDNLYIAGEFANAVYFDNITLTTTGGSDIFIVKYDQKGSALWAKKAGSVKDDKAMSIATDRANNVLISGSFGWPSITLGSTTLINSGPNEYYSNTFISKYDSTGKFLIAEKIGTTDGTVYVNTDSKSNIIASGNFYSAQLMLGQYTLNNPGPSTIFVAKTATCLVSHQSIYASICNGTSYTLPNGNVVSATGTYYSTLKTTLGCDSILTIYLNVISPSPIITANGPLSFCKGSTVTLNAGAGFASYEWSNGQTTQTIDVIATQSYTVKVTDSTGCVGTSKPAVVSVDTVPVLKLHMPPAVCFPNVIDLSAPAITAGSTVAPLSYWKDSSATIALTNYTTVDASGTYYIRLGSSGCFVIRPIVVTVSRTCVWPGDTDNDKIVNNYDLLPIGLYFQETGAARVFVSNAWSPYLASDWSLIQSNLANVKHVDSDGNGVIDSSDVSAIGANFSLVHPFIADPIRKNSSLPEFYFKPEKNNYVSGDTVNVSLVLGNSAVPLSKLYGIAFTLKYTSSLVESGSEQLRYPSSWFANPAGNALIFKAIQPSGGYAYAAETRTDHISSNGYGKIADFKFILKQNLPVNAKMNFILNDYKAIDEKGNTILLQAKNDSIIINFSPIGISTNPGPGHLIIYPNPFKSETTVFVGKELKNAVVKVVDVLGKQMKIIAVSGNEFKLYEDNLKAGIYFIQVYESGVLVESGKVVVR